MTSPIKPVGIYHEHPDWFRPLFAELEHRDIPYTRINAARNSYTPQSRQETDYALVFNRMSPSAHMRGNGNSIFYTMGYLAHLERLGVRVINGCRAYGYETNKAMQLDLLEGLGLEYPHARAINDPSLALEAANDMQYPIVVKANIGGSGAGIVCYETPEALEQAVTTGMVNLGIDGVALVQEYITARGGHITRVETLGGKYLYAINVYTTGESFNLCPADICQTTGGVELARSACPADAPRNGLTVEATTPPADVIAAVERIVQEAQIDVGGIEYMIDDRDGRLVYYDINALSNFVADARNVIGFDPHERLVDYLVSEARF